MTVPEGMIPIEDFAKFKGIDVTTAINGVREGLYIGRKVGDHWFVNSSISPESIPFNGMVITTSKAVAEVSCNENVVIIDIKMPFISMVIFMVKWVIASIPAFIILFIFVLILTSILLGMGLVII